MQFNISSFNKGFYYPRIFDNLRASMEYVEEESTPKKYVNILGIMNLWNTKDQFLMNRSDFWINEKKDMVMDRDGHIVHSVSKSVPSLMTIKLMKFKMI